MERETQKTVLVWGQFGRDEPEPKEKETQVEESHLIWATHLLCASFKCRERQLLPALIAGTACLIGCVLLLESEVNRTWYLFWSS